MDEHSFAKHESVVYLSGFPLADFEIKPFRKGGVQLYKNGVWLSREETVLKPSRKQLDLQRSEGISRIRTGSKKAHASCHIGPDHKLIEIRLETHNGILFPEIIDVAKDVISKLAGLDSEARKISDAESDKPRLGYIEVYESEVCFRYFSTIMNAEWSISFNKTENGEWQFSDFYY